MLRPASRAGPSRRASASHRMRWLQRAHRPALPEFRDSGATSRGPCRPGPGPGSRPEPAQVTRIIKRERVKHWIRRSHPTTRYIWPIGPPLDTPKPSMRRRLRPGQGPRLSNKGRGPEKHVGDPTRRNSDVESLAGSQKLFYVAHILV